MGMYNLVFGSGKDGTVLLAALGFKSSGEVGRYRDAWLEKTDASPNGYRIAVYTRNGGGNREEYMPDFSEHSLYLSDVDEDSDCTYATIYFRVPDELLPLIAESEASGGEIGAPVNMSDRWQEAIAAIGTATKV